MAPIRSCLSISLCCLWAQVVVLKARLPCQKCVHHSVRVAAAGSNGSSGRAVCEHGNSGSSRSQASSACDNSSQSDTQSSGGPGAGLWGPGVDTNDRLLPGRPPRSISQTRIAPGGTSSKPRRHGNVPSRSGSPSARQRTAERASGVHLPVCILRDQYQVSVLFVLYLFPVQPHVGSIMRFCRHAHTHRCPTLLRVDTIETFEENLDAPVQGQAQDHKVSPLSGGSCRPCSRWAPSAAQPHRRRPPTTPRPASGTSPRPASPLSGLRSPVKAAPPRPSIERRAHRLRPPLPHTLVHPSRQYVQMQRIMLLRVLRSPGQEPPASLRRLWCSPTITAGPVT